MDKTDTPGTTCPRRRRWHVAAAGIAVVTLAGAGIAYASIPGPGAVIHGCYATRGGTLRVVDSATTACGKGEQAIEWNQTGPQGQPGTPGAEGATGPSDAYFSTNQLFITLPPGNYALTAEVHTYVPDGTPTTGPVNQQCQFVAYGTGNTTHSVNPWMDVSPGHSIIQPVLGTATIVTDTFADVTLGCYSAAFVGSTMITATRVGALHDVTEPPTSPGS